MQKRTIIKRIKEYVSKNDGEITTADCEADSSPVIASLGKNTFQLAETFGFHKVTAVTYVHDTETDEDYIPYEDLKKDVLEEILRLVENYVDGLEKTMDKCRGENW
jgi:hypothetical protein